MKRYHDPLDAIRCLKETLPRLQEYDIPPTPDNFTVWYEYAAGTSPELSKEIDRLIAAGTEFTAAVNEDLYTRHFEGDEGAYIESVQAQVSGIVRELLGFMGGMGQDLGDFQGTLESCTASLDGEPTLGEMRGLVASLMTETKRVRDNSQNMERALSTLSQEVESMRSDIPISRATSPEPSARWSKVS